MISDEELMGRLAELPADAQEHFKQTVRLISLCYIDKTSETRGLLVAKLMGDTVLMSLNSNEMQAAELLDEAHGFVQSMVMHDAPPKELFN